MNCQIFALLLTTLALATTAVQSESCSCANPLICKYFVGLNSCKFTRFYEPPLPTLANTCCGPSCSYVAPIRTQLCSNLKQGYCLLDTTCSAGLPFQYEVTTGCCIQARSDTRVAKGYPPLIPFILTKEVCQSYNTKCGINCCCRETCPQQFCIVGKK